MTLSSTPSENSEYNQILALLKQPDSAVRGAFRVGSRVYGTAGPTSDHDYLVIVEKVDQKQDLLFGPNINVIVHGAGSFAAALNDGSVLAFEAHFAPAAHRLKEPRPPFLPKLNPEKLGASAESRSTSDFEKAKKWFKEELEPSKKKLFHSLRVPLFALQLMRTNRLTNFDAANDYFEDIMSDPSTHFEPYEAKYGALRIQLCAELKRGKRSLQQ